MQASLKSRSESVLPVTLGLRIMKGKLHKEKSGNGYTIKIIHKCLLVELIFKDAANV
jgi:hypothetical protein